MLRYLNHSMRKSKSFNEVLGIMQSGATHVNLYRTFKLDPQALEKQLEMREEARGLLRAH